MAAAFEAVLGKAEGDVATVKRSVAAVDEKAGKVRDNRVSSRSGGPERRVLVPVEFILLRNFLFIRAVLSEDALPLVPVLPPLS
jgi:hypothetical protein